MAAVAAAAASSPVRIPAVFVAVRCPLDYHWVRWWNGGKHVGRGTRL